MIIYRITTIGKEFILEKETETEKTYINRSRTPDEVEICKRLVKQGVPPGYRAVETDVDRVNDPVGCFIRYELQEN